MHLLKKQSYQISQCIKVLLIIQSVVLSIHNSVGMQISIEPEFFCNLIRKTSWLQVHSQLLQKISLIFFIAHIKIQYIYSIPTFNNKNVTRRNLSCKSACPERTHKTPNFKDLTKIRIEIKDNLGTHQKVNFYCSKKY